MKQILFGTDGIRGRVGDNPFTLQKLPHLGYIIGKWITYKYGKHVQVLVGNDTRHSSDFVTSGLQTGLLCHPLTIVHADSISTPALSAHVRYQERFVAGIMISASHNPYQDNGIKLFSRTGSKLQAEDETVITAWLEQQNQDIDFHELGSTTKYTKAVDDYRAIVRQLFDAHAFLAGKKIILDCAHGATSGYAQTMFEQTGAEIIAINNKPNGKNINQNCGAVHPQQLAQAVVEKKADCGFAFDGDGDRIIGVNSQGDIKDGDDLLALLATHPFYTKQTGIVGTTMTNQGMVPFLKNQCKKLYRTSVGDKHVLRKLQADKLLLGGESSGHIIMRDYLECGDGIVTGLKVLEVIAQTNNWDMKTFKRVPSLLINIPVKEKRPLDEPDLAQLIQEAEQVIPEGRLLVRYSGTENILRILVEDAHQEQAHTVAQNLANKFTMHLTK